MTKPSGKLEKNFNDAISYSKLATKPVNLKMDAMQGLFDGTKTLSIHANGPKEIVESIKFAQNVGVKRITMITNESAWYVKDFLKGK